MNRRTLLKFALITFIIGVAALVTAFYTFHFVTDAGLTFTWHEEAGKPFVTELIGDIGATMIGASLLSLIGAFVFYKKDSEQ